MSSAAGQLTPLLLYTQMFPSTQKTSATTQKSPDLNIAAKNLKIYFKGQEENPTAQWENIKESLFFISVVKADFQNIKRCRITY